MRGRRAEVVGLCCAACVVMVLLASTTRGVARAGAAAAGAADEASQQIPAIILPVAVPRVLLENGHCLRLEVRLEHGRHPLLDYVLATVRLDPVDARVGGLADDVGDRHN